jgi:hypothetical protein
MNPETQTEKPDIFKVAESLGCLPQKKEGQRFVGICPSGHGSKGGRCYQIYSDTQSFYCHSCENGGDAFDLIQFVKKCDFRTALEWARQNNFISGNGCRTDQFHRTEIPKADLRLFAILSEAARYFHSQLTDGYRDHLKKHYGLTDSIVNQLYIGYAPVDPDAVVKHLSQYFQKDQIKKTGLLTKNDKSFFQGQLMFPYWLNGFNRYFIGRKTVDMPEWKNGKYEKLPIVSDHIENIIFGLDSIKNQSYVYIAEGVTDCIALLQHNEPCISPVTVSFKKSDFEKIIPKLKGKQVYLVPDNEVNVAGLKGAESTKEHLQAAGIDCHIILLPRPDDKDKIDLNEFVRDHGIDAFRKLVKEQAPVNLFESGLLDVENFVLIDRTPRKKILSPWLTERSLTEIYAHRGLGKTQLCLAIVAAIRSGGNLGPWVCENPCGVVYVDAEMQADEMKTRVKGYLKNMPEPVAPLKIFSSEIFFESTFRQINLTDEVWRTQIYNYLKSNDNIKVLILDNLAALTPGIDENSKQEWDTLNQWLITLRFLGVAVIFVHHSGKSGGQRGTSGREDALDIVIKLEHPPGYRPDEGCKFKVVFEKSRNLSGKELEETIFELRETNGQYEFITSAAAVDVGQKIISLLGRGVPQKDIPDILDTPKQTVSYHKGKAIASGILDTKGRFTKKGEELYADMDE